MYEIYILKAVLLILIILFVYLAYNYISRNNLVTNTSKLIFNSTQLKYNERKKVNEKIMLEIGEVEEQNFIGKIDLLIQRSQISEKVGFNINAEMYITLNVLISIVAYVVSTILFHNWAISLIVMFSIVVTIYAIAHILSSSNYEKIDNQAIILCNILGNYSAICDDISDIIGNSSSHMEYPLNEYMKEFSNEVKLTGNVRQAFRSLNKKIENVVIKDLFDNLELCSYHDCNYDVVIANERNNIKIYMDSKGTREESISNGRNTMIFVLIIGIGCIKIISEIILNIKYILLNTSLGQGVLVYWILLIILIILGSITLNKQEGNL